MPRRSRTSPTFVLWSPRWGPGKRSETDTDSRNLLPTRAVSQGYRTLTTSIAMGIPQASPSAILPSTIIRSSGSNSREGRSNNA